MTDLPVELQRTWDAYLRAESIKAAAHDLGIHPVTVSRHLSSIRSILGVETNVQAATILARDARNAA
jgi:DNA-binding NarL/FixJ family response regulator